MREIFSRKHIPEIESHLPCLIDLLDSYQNAHLLEAADEVSEYLVALGKIIVPYLNLESKDSNFFNYFANYFIPKCTTEILTEMYSQLRSVMVRNDYTEETDLLIASSLLKRNFATNEIIEILQGKRKNLEQRLLSKDENNPLFSDYLNHINSLLERTI